MPPDSVFLYKPPPSPPIAVTLESNFNPTTGLLPISPIIVGTVIGYTAKKRDCIDCRLRGSSVRPGFW